MPYMDQGCCVISGLIIGTDPRSGIMDSNVVPGLSLYLLSCGKSVMYENSGVHSFSGVGCVLRASFSARKKWARHITASRVSTDLNCVTAENHYQDQTRLPSPFPPMHTCLCACLRACLHACLPMGGWDKGASTYRCGDQRKTLVISSHFLPTEEQVSVSFFSAVRLAGL